MLKTDFINIQIKNESGTVKEGITTQKYITLKHIILLLNLIDGIIGITFQFRISSIF